MNEDDLVDLWFNAMCPALTDYAERQLGGFKQAYGKAYARELNRPNPLYRYLTSTRTGEAAR